MQFLPDYDCGQAGHLGVQRGATLQLRRTPGADANCIEVRLQLSPAAQLDEPVTHMPPNSNAAAGLLPPPPPPPQTAMTASAAEAQTSEDPASSDTVVQLPQSRSASRVAHAPPDLQQNISKGLQPGSGGCSSPATAACVPRVRIVLSRTACERHFELRLSPAQAAALMPPYEEVRVHPQIITAMV